MLNIFYRKNGMVEVSQSESIFAKIQLEELVWVDMIDPAGAEKRAVEAFLGTEIQSRAQAEDRTPAPPAGESEALPGRLFHLRDDP